MVTLQLMIKEICPIMMMGIILISLILLFKNICLGFLPSPLRKRAKPQFSRTRSFYYHFWESIINGIPNTFIILMKAEKSQIIFLVPIQLIPSPTSLKISGQLGSLSPLSTSMLKIWKANIFSTNSFVGLKKLVDKKSLNMLTSTNSLKQDERQS